MKKRIRVTTIVEEKPLILFEGEANLRGNIISYFENDTLALTTIEIRANGLIINRHASDIKTELYLLKNEAKGQVTTSEGVLPFGDIKILSYEKQSSYTKLTYQIEDVVTIRIDQLGEKKCLQEDL